MPKYRPDYGIKSIKAGLRHHVHFFSLGGLVKHIKNHYACYLMVDRRSKISTKECCIDLYFPSVSGSSSNSSIIFVRRLGTPDLGEKTLAFAYVHLLKSLFCSYMKKVHLVRGNRIHFSVNFCTRKYM